MLVFENRENRWPRLSQQLTPEIIDPIKLYLEKRLTAELLGYTTSFEMYKEIVIRGIEAVGLIDPSTVVKCAKDYAETLTECFFSYVKNIAHEYYFECLQSSVSRAIEEEADRLDRCLRNYLALKPMGPHRFHDPTNSEYPRAGDSYQVSVVIEADPVRRGWNFEEYRESPYIVRKVYAGPKFFIENGIWVTSLWTDEKDRYQVKIPYDNSGSPARLVLDKNSGSLTAYDPQGNLILKQVFKFERDNQELEINPKWKKPIERDGALEMGFDSKLWSENFVCGSVEVRFKVCGPVIKPEIEIRNEVDGQYSIEWMVESRAHLKCETASLKPGTLKVENVSLLILEDDEGKFIASFDLGIGEGFDSLLIGGSSELPYFKLIRQDLLKAGESMRIDPIVCIHPRSYGLIQYENGRCHLCRGGIFGALLVGEGRIGDTYYWTLLR